MPCTFGSKEAANVIIHQIIENLVLTKKFNIFYCLITNKHFENNKYTELVINDLKKKGVQFLKPLIVENYKKKSLFNLLYYLLSGSPEKVFSGAELQNIIADHFTFKPDLVLTVWSEYATHACSKLKCKKFNYSGNSQYDVYAAHHELSILENLYRSRKTSFQKKLIFFLKYKFFKFAYMASMKRYDLVWNVAKNDAHTLKKSGVNAKYLQNMWPVSNVKNDTSSIKLGSKGSQIVKIVASVGNLTATGNSLGFYTLGTEILPRMKKLIGEGMFEFHIFGRGKPMNFLNEILNDSHIKIRGFVDDIDTEISNSDIFLVPNNSRKFKVGHTRFLHAWSRSVVVVAFEDSALAMPEIVHEYNALLGSNAHEICDLIVRSLENKKLKQKLINNGLKTLNQYFNPEKITNQISSDMFNLLI